MTQPILLNNISMQPMRSRVMGPPFSFLFFWCGHNIDTNNIFGYGFEGGGCARISLTW